MRENVPAKRVWLRGLLAVVMAAGLMMAGHPYAASLSHPHGRLVKVEPLPEMDLGVCRIPSAVQWAERATELQEEGRGRPSLQIQRGRCRTSIRPSPPSAWTRSATK
jgi:hypothetical protein